MSHRHMRQRAQVNGGQPTVRHQVTRYEPMSFGGSGGSLEIQQMVASGAMYDKDFSEITVNRSSLRFVIKMAKQALRR